MRIVTVNDSYMVPIEDVLEYARAVRVGTAVEAALIAEPESPHVADQIRRLYSRAGNLVDHLDSTILELSERSDGGDCGPCEHD